jgi:hypothetical protein
MDAARVTDLKARGLGLAVAGLGGLLLRLEVFGALGDAESHASSVSVSLTLLVLSTALVLLGLLLVLFGSSAVGPSGILGRRVRGADGKPSRVLGVLVVLVLFAPGIAIYAWLQLRLHELGYG